MGFGKVQEVRKMIIPETLCYNTTFIAIIKFIKALETEKTNHVKHWEKVGCPKNAAKKNAAPSTRFFDLY